MVLRLWLVEYGWLLVVIVVQGVCSLGLRVVGCVCWLLVVGISVAYTFDVVIINSVVVVVYIWVYVFVWIFGLVNYIDLAVVLWMLRCLWCCCVCGFAVFRLCWVVWVVFAILFGADWLVVVLWLSGVVAVC